jgi:hypothetical protein
MHAIWLKTSRGLNPKEPDLTGILGFFTLWQSSDRKLLAI